MCRSLKKMKKTSPRRVNTPWGPFELGESEKTAPLTAGVIGKHAVYFEFVSEEEDAIAAFDRFTSD